MKIRSSCCNAPMGTKQITANGITRVCSKCGKEWVQVR